MTVLLGYLILPKFSLALPDPNSPHGAYRLEIISACSEGSGDSTIDYPCSDFTSGMVGVDWLWVHTEEALMETMCRHRIVRAAFNVDLARNPVSNTLRDTPLQ